MDHTELIVFFRERKMIIKTKLSSILTGLRKIFFPTNDEIYKEAMNSAQLGLLGKIFMAIYFPSIKAGEDKKITLRRILNRIILIAGISGVLCIWSIILDLHFLKGVFLIFCMSAIFPYIGYVVAKKQLYL